MSSTKIHLRIFSKVFHGFSTAPHPGISFRGFCGIAPRIFHGISPGVPPAILFLKSSRGISRDLRFHLEFLPEFVL